MSNLLILGPRNPFGAGRGYTVTVTPRVPAAVAQRPAQSPALALLDGLSEMSRDRVRVSSRHGFMAAACGPVASVRSMDLTVHDHESRTFDP